MSAQTILFAGGGTVGHLAPGFALADALASHDVATAFATPGEGREATWFEGRAAPLTIPAVRLPRRPAAAAAFPFRLRRCIGEARRVLDEHHVGCVVALGGWPSAPAAFAARKAGARLVLFAADAVPGRVVRWLRKRADRIYVAYPSARDALGGDAIVTGPLLRRAVLSGTRSPAQFDLDPNKHTLLVTGGSLGAQGLNDRVLAGMRSAVAADPTWTQRLQVLHATGGQAGVAEAYEALGLRHHVVPFVHDMGTAYATADLLVGRAGAGTCAEVEATSTPAVLVPYPHHADQQQVRNAADLSARVSAVTWIDQDDLTPAAFVSQVLNRIVERSSSARNRSTDGAATETAADLIRFLRWGPSSD